MKSVLISIQPKWCELIASGKKTVEVRKTKPKLETPFKVYIYCTKQKVNGEILLTYDKKVEGRNRGLRDTGDIPLAGKVIGEFVCNCIGVTTWCSNVTPSSLKEFYNEETCLTDKGVWEYTKGKSFYEWHISNLVIYDKPRELGEFYVSIKDHWETYDPSNYINGRWQKPLTRPPQSWCYVERGDTE
jgi:predicted transcriptional regulator